MTELRIFRERSTRLQRAVQGKWAIAACLSQIDVDYSRLALGPASLDAEAHQSEVIEAYRRPLDTLMQRYGFAGIDALAVMESQANMSVLRREFLRERRHRGLEGRVFVDGHGLFYIRRGGYIYGLICEAGDFITLPPQAAHWFDMGARPYFRAIRLFGSVHGWDAEPTGCDLSHRFPGLEELAQTA